MYFFLFLLLNTTKILDIIWRVRHKILKGGRTKAGEIGTLELGSDIVVSSLGLSLCLMDPRLGTKTAGNTKTPLDIEPPQKTPSKASCLWPSAGKKLSKPENLQAIPTLYFSYSTTVHSATAEHTLFSSACQPSTKTGHILSQKANLNHFKRTEILQSVFSDHSDQIRNNNRKVT